MKDKATPPHPPSWKTELQLPEGCGLEEGLRRGSAMLERLDDFFATVPGLDDGGKADLRLVCDEIGSNVVRHSNPEKPSRLDIEIRVEDKSLRMRIRDNGSEFNPLRHDPKPYVGSEKDKRSIGGLGLYLIRQLFPLTSYQRTGGWNVSEVVYVMGRDGWKKMQRSADVRKLT